MYQVIKMVDFSESLNEDFDVPPVSYEDLYFVCAREKFASNH